MARYVYPLDPDCPEVKKYTTNLLSDPMTHAMRAPVDDIMEDFTNRHRIMCKHCQEYGAAHAYVE